MLLVTAAYEETWDGENDILLLGRWCHPGVALDKVEGRSFRILDDPFSDPASRKIFYAEANTVYESCLPILAEALNQYHSASHDDLYWRRIIGPWLKLYVNRVVHMWACISAALESGWAGDMRMLRYEVDDFVSDDLEEFENLITTQGWNHIVAFEIIKSRSLCGKINYLDRSVERSPKGRSKVRWSAVAFFSKVMRVSLRCFGVDQKYFIYSPYIHFRYLLPMMWSLRAFPYQSGASNASKVVQGAPVSRGKFNISPGGGNSDVADFLIRNAVNHMPKAYLEAYANLRKAAIEKYNWPANPTTVVTAVSQFSDDLFKIYSADVSEKGARLKIISHGGFGRYSYSDFQDLEFNFCDDYFTWGWSDYSSKCWRGFIPRPRLKRRRQMQTRFVLMTLYSVDQFRKFISVGLSYEDYIDRYLREQRRFINDLDVKVRESLTLKLAHHDPATVVEFLGESLFGVEVLSKGEKIAPYLSACDLSVVTYDATVIVESLVSNIPTVGFWRVEDWPVSENAKLIMESLRRCNILHETPESAALHINRIWGDIESWWKTDDVQRARKDFCSEYGRLSPQPVKELLDFLRGSE